MKNTSHLHNRTRTRVKICENEIIVLILQRFLRIKQFSI